MMTCYDDGMRTIIDLPDEQVRALAMYCARERVSRAEAVRRAVEVLTRAADRERDARQAAFDASFGIWKDRRDAREIVEELRSEWDRDDRVLR